MQKTPLVLRKDAAGLTLLSDRDRAPYVFEAQLPLKGYGSSSRNAARLTLAFLQSEARKSLVMIRRNSPCIRSLRVGRALATTSQSGSEIAINMYSAVCL